MLTHTAQVNQRECVDEWLVQEQYQQAKALPAILRKEKRSQRSVFRLQEIKKFLDSTDFKFVETEDPLIFVHT